MATIIALISAMIIAIYTFVMVKKMGRVPYSLSETYYRLEHKKWFGAAMILTGFTFMVSALTVTPEYYQFLVFLSFIGMIMIALSPNFTEKKDAVIHYIGTGILFISTQVWITYTEPWLLLLWFFPIAYIIWYISKHGITQIIEAKPVFWLEVTATAIIYISLFRLCLIY